MILAVAHSPDGRMLAAADHKKLTLWESASGRRRRTIPFGPVWVREGALDYSADGRTLLAVHSDGTALTWDVTSPAQRKAAPSPREMDTLWATLAGEDAAAAYGAVRTLAASPKQSAPFLREKLRSLDEFGSKRIARLADDLDSENFATREKATADLEQFGELAEPVLRQALAGRPSAEARSRLERLAAALEKSRGVVTSPDWLRALRAVEALESAGTEEARQALKALSGGPAESLVAQEAKAALDRLGRRPKP